MSELGGSAGGVDLHDDARFARVYELHHRSIRDYCRRRLTSHLVDDAVAETFLTAWRKIDEVPADDAALLWLYRVADRVIGHQWRSTNRRRRLHDELRSISPRCYTASFVRRRINGCGDGELHGQGDAQSGHQ